MKKTRNLFVLKGQTELIKIAFKEINFKGLTVLDSESITYTDIATVFNNNKSIVCSNIPAELKADAIYITIADSSQKSLESTNNTNILDINVGNIASQFQAVANKYDCDIGDHKSNSSGLTGMPTKDDCPYCKFFINGVFKDALDRTLYQSPNFFVTPTVGEFIKGYLLIIPFEHVMSNAELNSTLRKEFLDVLNDVIYILKLTYNPSNILIWENGSGNGGIGKSKSSIVHSHTHVAISNTLDADKVEELAGFPLIKISYDDLPLYSKYSYLLIRGLHNNDWRINNNPDLYIPRQYIRQLLLIEDNPQLPSDIWDWRTYPFIDKLKMTCSDIRMSLVEHWDILPERIKSNTKDFLD